jgi:hypothetical protein
MAMKAAAAKVHFLHSEVSVDSDAMLTVKGGIGNLNVAGFFLAGQKAFRQRRALIGQGIFCRDYRQPHFFTALSDELLRGITSNHAAAQDDDGKGLHYLGLETALQGALN